MDCGCLWWNGRLIGFVFAFHSEPELHDWVNEKDKDKKIRMQVTDEIKFAIDRYYFS